MTKFWILILTFSILTLNLHSQTGEEIKANILAKIDKVKDFEADITLEIDVSFLNVPKRTGKIYYISPDQTHLDIEGFTMLPKQGVGNVVADVLKDKNSTIILTGQEKYTGVDCHILKIIPNSSDNDLALATMWIDSKNYIALKAEMVTKNSGSYVVDMQYKKFSGFDMPIKSTVSLSIPEFSLPKTMTGDFGKKDESKKPVSKDGKVEGKVIITYDNYKINTGRKKIDIKNK